MTEPREIDPGSDERGGEAAPEPRLARLARVTRVTKRSGRVVPFDATRIEAAVLRAQAAVGEDDALFAVEVADVVSLALASRYARAAAIAEAGAGDASIGAHSAPGIEEIQDLVEQALIEMGRSRVAKAYILYRDRRARSRDALVVHDADRSREGRMPIVRDGSGTAPWSQARIVAALMEEAELPREIAEDVAERVERRVFDAGLRRLSTALIREFVDNELKAMGLAAALRRHEPIGIPRHDLRGLLARPRLALESIDDHLPPPGGLDSAVAGEVLRRLALEDVLPERTADQHRAGDLFVEDLERPHVPLVRSLPAELLLSGDPAASPATELVTGLAPLVGGTSIGVVVENLHRAFPPGARGTRGAAELAEALRALAGVARVARRRIDLAAPGGRGGGFVARLLRELRVLDSQGSATPRLFLSWTELEAALTADPELVEASEVLLARGRLVPVWHARTERWAAPGCRRRQREPGALACGGAVALHLPRIARRAGPWREDLAFASLAEAVRAALEGFRALDTFRRESAASEAPLRERVDWALTPVGLAEALRILGDGELRPEQGARLLGVLADAAARFGAESGLSVSVSPFFGARARLRFAALDAEEPRPAQPRLFADLPAPEEDRFGAYEGGFAFPLPGGGGEALATLLGTVPSGAIFPFASVPSTVDANPPPHPLVAAWRSFDRRRRPDPAARPTRRRPRPEAGSLFRSP